MTDYKPSIMDLVVDKLHERRKLVRQKLQTQYKRVKPFRSEPVTPEELIYIHDNMANEDVDYAIERYGYDTVDNRMGEIAILKQQRRK